MPLPGGPSDKLGNQYEAWWTASMMLELMQSENGIICIEPLGDEGEKIEFWIERDGCREVHQVKGHLGFQGSWPLHELKSRGVLGGMQRHLTRLGTVAHFVSTIGVNNLGELTERARSAGSFDAFQDYYLASDEAKSALQNFKTHWGEIDDVQSYGVLQRIHVRTIGEQELKSKLGIQVARWFDTHWETVADALTSLARSNLGKELMPKEIWRDLERRAITSRPASDFDTLEIAVLRQTDRYLATGKGIGAVRIPRVETERLRGCILGGAKLVWVLGEAGSGKSEVTRDLVRVMRAEMPVLALRLDHLQHTTTPGELGAHLGLGTDPVHALAAVAQGQDALLVIDQLDALSLISGRRDALLGVIEECLSAATFQSKLRILLACRSFDVEHDHRLRALMDDTRNKADSVRIGALSAIQVHEVLDRLGRSSPELTSSQINLLTLPLHLSIFADVLSTGNPFATFGTATDLFHEYCRRKRLALKTRMGSDEWPEAMRLLIAAMDRNQSLSTPWRVLGPVEPYAEAMVSEHVLAKDLGRIAFFHESLFDYLFGFCFSPERSLLEWLVSTEQGLFRRSQLRQVLSFRRDDAPRRYAQDIRNLLTASPVRFHIRHLVLQLLGRQAEPSGDEVRALLAFIEHAPEAEKRHAFMETRGSRAWFDALRPTVPAILESGRVPALSQALWWLVPMAERAGDDVAALLQPYVNRGGEWDGRIGWFVGLCHGFTQHQRFVDLVVELVGRGALDGRRGFSDIWMALHQKEPHASLVGLARLLRALLERDLALHIIQGGELKSENHYAADVLQALAIQAPAEFVKQLLPVFTAAASQPDHEGLKGTWPGDALARVSLFATTKTTWDGLISGLVDALSFLLDSDPSGVRDSLNMLSALPSWTPQATVAKVYQNTASLTADEAVRWLLADTRRLQLGRFVGGNVAEDLVSAIGLHASQASFASLEQQLLDWYPEYERTSRHREGFGHSQWRLLFRLPEARLSKAGARRRGELLRRFQREPSPVESGFRAHAVGSPIEVEATQRMSDEDWLRAIRRHDNDGHGWREDGTPVGGAPELASVLRKQSKSHPARFAALAATFPADAHHAYVSAVLAGIEETEVDLTLLECLIRRVHDIEGRPYGVAVCRLLSHQSPRAWSDNVLDIVCWYATKATSPAQEGERQFSELSAGETYNIALNSTRAVAAECLGLLIQADATRIPRLLAAVESVVDDPHPAVRTQGAIACACLLRHDALRALVLMERLLDHGGPTIATPPLERLFHIALPAHTERLLPALGTLLEHNQAEVVTMAARRVTLAALSHEAAQPLALRCLEGTEAQRKGAAAILASNVKAAAHRDFCERGLQKLFHDKTPDVRMEAANCFHMSRDIDIATMPGLVHAFIESPAFPDALDGLFYALERSTGDAAALIVEAAAKFLNLAGDDAGDMQTGAAGTAHTVKDLVLRAYTQSAPSSETRTAALDCIDRMYLHAVHGLDATVAEVKR
jgi:hypothetical protein